MSASRPSLKGSAAESRTPHPLRPPQVAVNGVHAAEPDVNAVLAGKLLLRRPLQDPVAIAVGNPGQGNEGGDAD